MANEMQREEGPYESPYQLIREISPSSILFLDIETVPAVYPYEKLDQKTRDLWHKKFRHRKNFDPVQNYASSAIYPEFGKIVTISLGFFTKASEGNEYDFRIISIGSHDEKLLLEAFKAIIEYKSFGDLWQKWENNPRRKTLVRDALYFMGHNIREFDIPYIARRMLINNITLPAPLQLLGFKNWDIMHLIDTLDLWKFGDQRSYISLELLASALGIPSPKEVMSGQDVYRYYYGIYYTIDGKEVIKGATKEDLKQILIYCQGDVITVAQIFRKLRGEALLSPQQIISSPSLTIAEKSANFPECDIERLGNGLFWLHK